MPGESRGTLRAAPCACVELISSPPSLLSALRYRPLPLSRSRVLAAPEESTKSLGTWPRCLFAPTYPLLLIAASPPLPLSLSSSLSHPLAIPPSPSVISSSPFSLRGTFAFLRCCVLYSRYRHPLIKLSHSSFPLPSYLSSSRSIASSLSRLSFPHFILFFSGTFLLLFFTGLFMFYVLRLIFSIQHPLIKLYFASPYGFPQTFWEIAFLSRSHNCMFRRINDE